jgi:hypothetical protein
MTLDQDAEFGLTLIAFGWRAHLTAPFGDGPTRADLAPLGLKKASARGYESDLNFLAPVRKRQGLLRSSDSR